MKTIVAAGYGPLEEIAGETPATPPATWRYSLQLDLEDLRALGYDVGYDQKVARYRWRASPFGLQLEDSHLAALAHLRHTFADQTLPQVQEIRSLLDHLVTCLPPAGRKRLSKIPIEIIIRVDEVSDYATIDSNILRVISNALHLQRQIEFDYCSPRHGQTLRHCVSPSPLVLKNGHVYLHGYKDGDTKQLTFRLEHIVPKTIVCIKRSARPAIIHTQAISYWLSAEIARGGVSPRFLQHQATVQSDGSAIVNAITANLWEAHKILLTYGAGCRVLTPPALVDLIREAILKMVQFYTLDNLSGI
ncbi:MAG: WYL domain-containing protein [Chloroflexota bacterium]|nr:WYL domain-containing protein [Chloroflexota bacterium]